MSGHRSPPLVARLAALYADLLAELWERGVITLDERRHYLGKWNEALDANE